MLIFQEPGKPLVVFLGNGFVGGAHGLAKPDQPLGQGITPVLHQGDKPAPQIPFMVGGVKGVLPRGQRRGRQAQ